MFFMNISLKTDKRDEVIDVIKEKDLIGSSFVSPILNGWLSVYNEAENENSEEVYDLGSELSSKLSCGAIVFEVYDSDICMYRLYKNGELIDSYNSKPDYFEPVSEDEKEKLKGNPELLLPLCPPETKVEDIKETLEKQFTYEEDRVRELAKILGIKNADWGCKYLSSDGNEETVEGWKDFWNSFEEESQKASEG